MKAYKKLMIATSLFIVLAVAYIAAGYDYYVYTPIEDVDITYPAFGQIFFAGCDYTVTCTTSTDIDCHQEGGDIVYDDDPVTHTWSGPGTFSGTGTSVTWTTPTAAGRATIHVTADDSPLANDTPQYDRVGVVVSNIIYVDEDATAGNDDGTTWANAFLKLQDALDAADSNCLEIWVAEGTYYPDEGESVTDNDRSETFQLIDGVETYGGFDGTETSRSQRDYINNVTILSGDIGTVDVTSDNSYHVVYSDDCCSSTVIDGFTITKGNADYDSPGPDSCGGGMFNQVSSPRISNCTFIENNATSGGGAILLFPHANSVQEITECIFTENTSSGFGGAIFDYGVVMENDELKMTNCVISDNSTGLGGGLYALVPTGHTFTSCLFTGNHADDDGGAIYLLGHAGLFVNLTVVANDADDKGGGIYTRGTAGSCHPELTNCIFWDNEAADGEEIYNDEDDFDPNFSYCDIEGGINGSKCGGYDSIDGGGNINSNPNFLNCYDPNGPDNQFFTRDDGLGLGTGSPCIDAGDNDAISESNDIIGTSRKIDDPNTTDTGNGTAPIVDMGAYEYDPDLPHFYPIYVDKDATAGNDDGATWANAFLKLQDALDIATSGNEIWVAEGTYKPSKKTDPEKSRTATFMLVDGVEMYGGFDGTETSRNQRDWTDNETVLSGDIGTPDDVSDNCVHVVTGNGDANTIIDGFVITKGNADHIIGISYSNFGAGMLNKVCSPTIVNCTFTYNQGDYAAGMGNDFCYPSVTVKDCVFTNNTAPGGGALANSWSDAEITNCVFSFNNGEDGGAIANVGGGLVMMENCLLTGNEAHEGAAIYNIDQQYLDLEVEITNCTLVDNDANYGGGIYSIGCDAVVTNCILWGNDANDDGGEIYNSDDADPTFSYCDIEGGLNGSKCGGYDSIDGGNNINSDPDFVDDTDPDGNDNEWATSDDGLALDSGSPCIDEGDNSAISEPNDITGATRKVDGDGDQTVTVDMGAYENQGS